MFSFFAVDVCSLAKTESKLNPQGKRRTARGDGRRAFGAGMHRLSVTAWLARPVRDRRLTRSQEPAGRAREDLRRFATQGAGNKDVNRGDEGIRLGGQRKRADVGGRPPRGNCSLTFDWYTRCYEQQPTVCQMSLRDMFSSAGKRKYELVRDQQIFEDNATLYRIRALKSFGNVKAGALGGYVSSERNLSQGGDCWVADDAHVYGDAYVSANAQVSDNACVFANAKVSGDARVFGMARIYDAAQVFDNASVYGDGQVFQKASVYGEAIICGHGLACGDAIVYGETIIAGHAQVLDQAMVSGARVSGQTQVRGKTGFFGNPPPKL